MKDTLSRGAGEGRFETFFLPIHWNGRKIRKESVIIGKKYLYMG